MKVKCKSCGKKFDPDKTSSMCPKCGSWYVEKRGPGQYDSGVPEEYDKRRYNQDSYSEWFKQKNREWLDKSKKEDNVFRIISFVVILLIIVSMLWLALDSSGVFDNGWKIFGSDDGGEDITDEETDEETYEGDGNFYVDDIPVTGYEFGDEITCDTSYGYSGWLVIDSVKPIEVEAAEVPEGYVIYDMEYELGIRSDSDQNESSIDEDIYVDIDCFNVYMRSKSGEMLMPMYQSDIDDIMPGVGYAEDTGVADRLDPDYGHLYFMVRSGDYAYMVVYSRNNNSINNIYIVGDKADTSDWYDVSELNVPKGRLYKIYDGDYVQKLEKDNTYTMLGGSELSSDEICRLSGINLDDDTYDYYLVRVILLNHGSRVGSCGLVIFDTGSDMDSTVANVSYGDYTGDELTPMSIVYQYVVYCKPKGQDGNISLTYEFGSSIDEVKHESIILPIPE